MRDSRVLRSLRDTHSPSFRRLFARVLLLCASLWAFAPAVSAEDSRAEYSRVTGLPLNAWLTVAGVATAPLWFDKEGLGFAYDGGVFGVGFDLLLNNDRRYTPSEAHMRGRYFDLRDGHLDLAAGPLSARAGRIVHHDETPGPYSLFISSRPLPTTVLDVRLDDGFFFYNTRWLELNRRPALYTYEVPVIDSTGAETGEVVEMPLERGAIYKVYGVDFGRLRVGLQESVVYLNAIFYPEYFLSPLPMYFTQLVNSTFGKPWTQIANENSLMGFFVEYEWDEASVFGQFLIDDWNDMGIEWLGVGDWSNPAKFAWYAGGTLETAYGTVGLYHAGATKFTFEPTYADELNYNRYPYSYTYFPVAEYTRGDGTLPILPADNYIGYHHGENNVAFMASLAGESRDTPYELSLEYTVSGAKSPTNPWHEADWHSQQGTELFGESPLEHRLLAAARAHRWFGPFRVEGTAELGGVWNELELQPVVGESGIFRPGDTNRLLWRFGLEVRYVFGLGAGTGTGSR